MGSTAIMVGVVNGCGLFFRALTDLVIALFSTIVLIVTGYACQLQFFLNANVLLIFGECMSNKNLQQCYFSVHVYNYYYIFSSDSLYVQC